MTARSFVGAEIRVLGSASAVLSTATTTSLDFGTPNDLLLTPLVRSGDRVVVVFEAACSIVTTAAIAAQSTAVTDAIALIGDDTATENALDDVVTALDALVIATAGSTDTVSFVVQDADDSAGSIGTPTTAITDGTLTGGTGHQHAVTGVQLQADRPWLRLRATSDGTTDTFHVRATVLAIPGGI
jgi:hypothetical protein